MICDPFDVVVVPFPFVDEPIAKRRPAVVLSQRAFNDFGYSILAMVTSVKRSRWPGDVDMQQLTEAGLPSPCLIRLKLFTLDNRVIERRTGQLGQQDRERLLENMRSCLAV